MPADNVINLYDTKRMLNALEQIPLASAFLHNAILYDTDTIDINLVKKGRRVASYVCPAPKNPLANDEPHRTPCLRYDGTAGYRRSARYGLNAGLIPLETIFFEEVEPPQKGGVLNPLANKKAGTAKQFLAKMQGAAA